MHQPPTTTYSPVVDPRDLNSLPNGLGANDETHVPLPPRREPLRRAPPWLRRLRDAHRLVVNFCYSDHRLLHWELAPGAAEAAVARLAPAAALTLDVPFYGFMTPAQRERAMARLLGATYRATRVWEPLGIDVVPLIKGLAPWTWRAQLALARDLGLRRCAFHARETLLEGDGALLSRFLHEAKTHRLRPLLLGLFGARTLTAGGYDAAAAHHYVLARRGRMLDRSGRARRARNGSYSELLRRFLDADDVAGLNDHNFLRARERILRPAGLTTFGIRLT